MAAYGADLAYPIATPFFRFMTGTPNTPDSSLRVEYDPFGTRGKRKARNGRGGGKKERRMSAGRVLARFAALGVACALPFFILVRLSVALYSRWGWGNWASVLGAAAATTALLVVYAWLLRVRIQVHLL